MLQTWNRIQRRQGSLLQVEMNAGCHLFQDNFWCNSMPNITKRRRYLAYPCFPLGDVHDFGFTVELIFCNHSYCNLTLFLWKKRQFQPCQNALQFFQPVDFAFIVWKRGGGQLDEDNYVDATGGSHRCFFVLWFKQMKMNLHEQVDRSTILMWRQTKNRRALRLNTSIIF